MVPVFHLLAHPNVLDALLLLLSLVADCGRLFEHGLGGFGSTFFQLNVLFAHGRVVAAGHRRLLLLADADKLSLVVQEALVLLPDLCDVFPVLAICGGASNTNGSWSGDRVVFHAGIARFGQLLASQGV